MILHAFSTHLKAQTRREQSPETVLFAWLTRILLLPPAADDMVARVIHTEIAMLPGCHSRPVVFEGKTDTGQQLLRSLLEYCRSYDHWQFCRWVHEVRPDDFKRSQYGA